MDSPLRWLRDMACSSRCLPEFLKGYLCRKSDAPKRSRGLEHETEAPGAKRRRFSKHDVFLSHSGQEKAFVEQLYHDLKKANQHPFFDQDSDCLPKATKFAPEILEAAEQCRLGVVVVSEGYLTSKWPMLELSKFLECKVRVLPLFFKLSPSDLNQKEVETRWKRRWRELVVKGEVSEEVVELWSKAVKELRGNNGLEYAKFANSEYRYRGAVVNEICKMLPPTFGGSTDGIQGCDRLCKLTWTMFEAKVIEGESKEYECLGLYGMGGVGKTTLCKAMVKYFKGGFGGRVCHVELGSNEAKERLARVKRVVLNLTGFDKHIPDEEEGWERLKDGLRNQPPVFLAIDNVQDYEDSRDEARQYLKLVPSGSEVMVTARSQEIVKSVLGQAEYCKPIPRLEWQEAAMLFLSKAAPSKLLVSALQPKEREIVERCLSECQFADIGYPSRQYHPLVLRALGTYFFDVDSGLNVERWEEALQNKNKLQRCREADKVNYILGLNYHSLSDQLKLVFLDSALYSSFNVIWEMPIWWYLLRGNMRSRYEMWVLWISEVHGVSPSDARLMLKELQRLSLLEDSNLEVLVHDLYKEFARVLVEQRKRSKEWEWWMSDASNVAQLERFVMLRDKSLIGRPPMKLQGWRNLVFLELDSCNETGTDLELGGLNSLRVLVVMECKVKRIVCSCDNGYDDRLCCYKKPGRGCLSELVTVRLHLGALEDLPLLRHCPNLQLLEIVATNYDGEYETFPTSDAHSESHEPIDFKYLRLLRTFSLYGGRAMLGYGTIDSFIRWLLTALQLENLTAFDYRSCEDNSNGVGGYTIDLNDVACLSPRLSVLSLRLPGEIEEVKGLHLLSNLTTLNLNCSQGLRRLPDLHGLPELKWLCVHGCCKLEAPPCLRPGVQEIRDQGFASTSHNSIGLWRGLYDDGNDDECPCHQPYCGIVDAKSDSDCPDCKERKGSEDDYSKGSEDQNIDGREFSRSEGSAILSCYEVSESISEKEVIAFLQSSGPIKSFDLVTKFKDQLKNEESTIAFTTIVKKIAHIQTIDNINFIVLDEK